jgi:YHS domain-containing protein
MKVGARTILWIIIIGGLLFWMMRRSGYRRMGHGGRGSHHSGGGQKEHSGYEQGSARASSPLVLDHVCGLFVDPQASLSSRYRWQTYYFCSVACKENFDKEPLEYLEKDRK